MDSPSTLAALADLREWTERLPRCRVIVWGDLVADTFLEGTTTRVSREAPALVLRYESEEVRPGGAGNAALNAAALGARVQAFGYLGRDTAGATLRRRLEDAGIDTAGLVERGDGPTPTKTRVMAGGVHTVRQQILRIDNDRAWPSSGGPQLVDRLAASLPEADGLLISDYGLGSVTPAMFEALRPQLAAARIPVTLDSRHALLSFRGVSAATPNEAEVEEALRIGLDGDARAIEAAGRELLERLESDSVLITRGSCGMALFRPDRPTVHLPIHGTSEIADVTGAGDTVIATLTLAMAAGADVLDATRLANVAAGLVVLKHGTATVSSEELAAALRESA